MTKGCNPPVNDMFCPDAYVTRGAMAAFLHRALGGNASMASVPDGYVTDRGREFPTSGAVDVWFKD